MRIRFGLSLTLLATVAAPAVLHAERVASLSGSPAAMQEQNRVAKDHGLSFYRTAAEIRSAVASGELKELKGDENYEVAEFVSYPYLHPTVVLFIERLSAQYREACGQKLVVTSGVRPSSGQPANAHALSVHPAGMAVDLRVSDRASCRSWLEDAILNLERKGLLNGIREYRPPHYHIAVFPSQYIVYAQERMAEEEARRLALEAEAMERLAAGAATLLDSGRDGATNERRDRGGLPLALAAAFLAVPVGVRALRLRRRR